jgi:hypothetical protein
VGTADRVGEGRSPVPVKNREVLQSVVSRTVATQKE